jgi:hypothetical protein
MSAAPPFHRSLMPFTDKLVPSGRTRRPAEPQPASGSGGRLALPLMASHSAILIHKWYCSFSKQCENQQENDFFA